MGVTRPTPRAGLLARPIFGHAGEELNQHFCFGDAPRPHGHQSDRAIYGFPKFSADIRSMM